jgi:hypothetical protein
MFRFHHFFCIYVFIHIAHVVLHYSDGATLWKMLRARSGKDVYDDVPESSTRHRGAFRPPVPPPSPPMPPVSLEQLLAPLNAIVQSLVAIDERQVRQSQRQHRQESSYFDFVATQPLELTEITDPLEANHWLHVTESKFGLLHYSEFQKTLFAVQQLRGSTSAWWATYTAAIQDDHQVLWYEFCTAFCERHISAGIMCRNLQEFLDLQQGSNSVYEYIEKFNYLAQYGTHHVSTDDKKAELFRKGLILPFRDRLVLFRDVSFNALVSATIEHEGTYRALLAEEKKMRKRVMSGPSEDSFMGAPPKYCLVDTPSIGNS